MVDIYSIKAYWLAAHLGDSQWLDYNSLKYLTERKVKDKQFNFDSYLNRLTEYTIIEHNTIKLPMRLRQFRLTKKGEKYLTSLTINLFSRTEDEKWLLSNDVEDNITYAKMLREKYGV